MKGLDKKEIEKLYVSKNTQIRRLFLRLGADSESAHDLLQDVFINILKFSNSYDPERNSLSAWIRTISVNVYYRSLNKRYRDDNRQKQLERESTVESPDVSDEILSQQVHNLILESIDNLTEPERTIVYLIRIKNQKAVTVADKLGLSERTVYRRLVKGLESLRIELENRGLYPGAQS